jgi:polysaccharide transporter, PST family
MIAVGLIQVLILLALLLRAKGLAVMLGPEGVGIIGVVDQLVVTLTQISALGIPFTAMKFMAAAHSTSTEMFRDTYAAFARIIAGLAISVLILSIAVTSLAPGLLAGFAEYQDVLLIALFSVPPGMMTIVIAHTLAAEQRPTGAALYNLTFLGSLSLCGLIGAYLAGIRGFYIGSVAASAFVVIAVMIWFARSQGLSILRKGVSIRAELRKRPMVFSTAMSIYLTLVALAAGMLVVRYAIIDQMGEAQAGLLQSALSLSLSVGSILTTMTSLYLAPSLNRNESVEFKLAKAIGFANRVAMLLAVGAVPLALLPGLALTILYSSAFTPAAGVLVACLIWQCVFQLKSVYMHLLIGVDRPLSGATGSLLGLGVVVIAVFPLVPVLGLIAVPVALTLGEVAGIAFMAIRLLGTVGMPVPWRLLLVFVWLASVLGAAGLLFDSAQVIPALDDLGLRILFGAIVLGITWMMMPGDVTLRSMFTRNRSEVARDSAVH